MKKTSGKKTKGVSVVEVLFVVSTAFVLSAASVPKALSITKGLKSASDARTITGDTSLAKMRAASYFTKVRLHADLSGNSYQVDVWSKTSSQWVTEQSSVKTLPAVTMGYGTISTPPSGTQTTLAQAPACRDNSGNVIANSACIIFNSRGIPVDTSGSPTSNGAIYITDGAAVFAVTVSSMGLIQTWRTPAAAAVWTKL